MHMTDDMKRAHHGLQFLSASDPTAAASRSRHVMALIMLVTGARHRERRGAEPEIGGGFEPTDGDERLLMGVTSITGVAQLLLRFDVDDAAGPPVGLSLFRAEGGESAHYGRCLLWSPANDGRALVVPQATRDHGHFAFRRGSALRHIPGSPPGPLEAGLRRGAARRRPARRVVRASRHRARCADACGARRGAGRGLGRDGRSRGLSLPAALRKVLAEAADVLGSAGDALALPGRPAMGLDGGRRRA